jgi:hypothetical protein
MHAKKRYSGRWRRRRVRAGKVSLRATLLTAALCASGIGNATGPGWPDSNPVARDASTFDPNRPLQQENQLSVADHFNLALAGDMIIARP